MHLDNLVSPEQGTVYLRCEGRENNDKGSYILHIYVHREREKIWNMAVYIRAKFRNCTKQKLNCILKLGPIVSVYL